jgi:hypothetical protein
MHYTAQVDAISREILHLSMESSKVTAMGMLRAICGGVLGPWTGRVVGRLASDELRRPSIINLRDSLTARLTRRKSSHEILL